MVDLRRRSIEILLDNQSSSGAYVASPNFPPYAYCWFRDGAYIAYAMDLYGEHESATRFHAWAAAAINARGERVQRAVEKTACGEPLEENDILHTRYTLDGQEAPGEWPNYQLDGFGTWLWSLGQHCQLRGSQLPPEWVEAAGRVAAYMRALWREPCFDCWEEFPEKVHTSTLAAIYGGLQAHAVLTGDADRAPADIRTFIHTHLQRDHGFVKCSGSREVDASLLGLATPYRVVAPADPRMRATVARIESELRSGGGVHRYCADAYYGGGEWLLLTAWLGWHYIERGELERARAIRAWVETQTGEGGNLPEQVPASLNAPSQLEAWRARWGESASPLLWSHAMYLILLEGIRRAEAA